MYTNSEPSLSIQLAIEATRFITPFDEGLTTKEIYEITERLGFMRGEVSDAFMNLQKFNSIQSFWGSEKVTLGDSYPFNTIFWMRFRPDPVSETLKRSIVLSLLDDLKRNGSYNYSLNIELFSTKILEMDSSNTGLQIYSFLRSLEMAKWIKLADDKKSIIQVQKMSLEGAESIFSRMEKRNESERFHKIYPIVIEVMSRRGSIIPTSTDPVDGFYEFLEKIRGEKYKLWWIQISSELRQLDHKRNPTSLIVLSCAMCEAMLTLVIDFSMGTDFEMTKFIKVNEPRTWKFIDMVRSVSIGSKPLHITEDIRKKLEAMNEHRKRIHPAAFLESGGLIPDLKPEQSEMALNTTKALARIAVDWIASHGLNQQE